jgi:alkaline phosphatase D
MRFLPNYLLFFSFAASGQSLISSGPMNGFSDHREAALWVQTKSPAVISFRFREIGSAGSFRFTESRQTNKESAYAATIIADSLLPGKRYEYEVLINGKTEGRKYSFQTPPLWMHRTDPPEFSVAVGSCTYVNEPLWDRPGKGYGDSLQIFQTIARQKPDLMLWVGDNTYTREGDWNSRGGFHAPLHPHPINSRNAGIAEYWPALCHLGRPRIWSQRFGSQFLEQGTFG